MRVVRLRLGYVVDGTAEQLHISDAFLFKPHYIVHRSDVDHYEEGDVVLKLTMDECVARQDG